MHHKHSLLTIGYRQPFEQYAVNSTKVEASPMVQYCCKHYNLRDAMKIPHAAFVVVALASLTGCGATVKASSPRSVVVHAMGVADAQALATTECAKHGRFARFGGTMDAFVFTFDCVQ